MRLDDINGLQGESIVYKNITRRNRRIERRRRRMCWSFVLRILARLRQGIGNIAILGRGGEGAYSGRIRGGCDVGKEGHVGDIVEIDLILENDG